MSRTKAEARLEALEFSASMTGLACWQNLWIRYTDDSEGYDYWEEDDRTGANILCNRERALELCEAQKEDE